MANSRIRSFGMSFVMVAAVGIIHPLMVTVGYSQRVAVTVSERAREMQRVTVDVDNVPLVQVLQEITHQAGLVPLFDKAILPSAKRVTLHVHEIAAVDALQQALRGTGLMANVYAKGTVIIVPVVSGTVATGSIAGKVIDAQTKRPLRGATVTLDESSQGTVSGDDGTFRIVNIVSGAHTVHVRLIGYVKAMQSVSVVDEQTTTIIVTLGPSANTLDQVVVTGTVVQTELKAVPNAITVITAKQIEDRGITKIDQLFRGDVPGLFAQNQGSSADALLDEVIMFSRGATALSTASAGVDRSTGNTNPIKTYVDGVELADPKYLSQIDPQSIERIEILTGPQASTIYGSNAINGVMQIFTKRGSSSYPQLTLSLLSGFVQNNFSSALTPQHDYSAQVSGLEGGFSYNAGGSWNYMGPWTPDKQLTRTGGFGGARLEVPTHAGRVTADVTLRRSLTQSLQRGAQYQKETNYRATGWYTYSSALTGISQPTTRTLTGQTLGLTLSYVPTSWWSHELGLGQDASDTETRYTARGYVNIEDTTLLLLQDRTDRRSLHYTTTAHIPIAAVAQATVTLGADEWQNLTYSMAIHPQTLTGALVDAFGSPSITRQPDHNTGGFLQTQLGVKDRLFFTYGLRAEWNPAFGEEAQPNYAPRYGIAYTQELGSVTVKLRGSYGRSTRPPQPTFRTARTYADIFGPSSWASFAPYYAVFDYYLANPDLTPEHQQGSEGGVDLYWGTRGSLMITRYNQTVDGLIDSPVVDSVRSLIACRPDCDADSEDPQGYGYNQQFQYLNVGSIRNQGWELQGSVNVGPITTRGTYSWTKSRVIGVTPKYRALFVNNAQYQPGATFRQLPEHTWAFGVTYTRTSSAVALNLTGLSRVITFQDDLSLRSLSGNIRLRQNRLNVSFPLRSGFNNPYALADLTASHRFLPWAEGVLQIQNVTDHYRNDSYGSYASLGRQTKLGLRLR